MSAIPVLKTGHAALLLASSAFVLLACSEPVTSPSGPEEVATPAFSNSVSSWEPATLVWQAQARQLVAANNLSPLAVARVLALVSVAQYGAVKNSTDVDYPDGTIPNDGFGPGGRARYEAERGAVAGASSKLLGFIFPAAAPALEQLVRDMSGAQAHPQFVHGFDAGIVMANQMIQWAMNDHFSDPWTGTVPVGPGLFIPNGPPAGPQFGTVTPYFMTAGSQFRPPPPPAFGSAAFLADLNEVSVLSATRTPAQLAIAQFWNLPAGTYTPVGYWNDLAGGLIQQNRLNERAAAHVFALLHTAMMDAVIGCWDAKYFYWVIRPWQADPTITTPIGKPNHPSYPSGHSCNSSAATTVLTHFFPDQAGNLASLLEEAGVSRIYGGIHYEFDITSAVQLGTSVAQLALTIDQSSGLLSVIN
jgi:membrane-associated phospholipid phosphatase